MSVIRCILIALVAGSVSVSAQTAATAEAAKNFGSIAVKGKSIATKDKKLGLARKRFYLFSGGIADNTALIARIQSAEITSKNCYYTKIGASPCLINWLQEESCETPFCRKIDQADLENIKEFKDSYNKGLPLYGKKPTIALDWILNNLPENLVSGYYLEQKGLTAKILGGVKPLQSTMTTSTASLATFVDIPVGDAAEKYLISNVVPVEVDDKSLVWVCELKVQSGKQTSVILSSDPANKKCMLTVRELTVCAAGICEKK